MSEKMTEEFKTFDWGSKMIMDEPKILVWRCLNCNYVGSSEDGTRKPTKKELRNDWALREFGGLLWKGMDHWYDYPTHSFMGEYVKKFQWINDMKQHTKE
jgi:hypothetical protein